MPVLRKIDAVIAKNDTIVLNSRKAQKMHDNARKMNNCAIASTMIAQWENFDARMDRLNSK